MENTEKLNINIPADYNGLPIELVYREGDAQVLRDPKDPRPWVVEGVITSINEYVGKRAYSDLPIENKEVVVFSLCPANPRIAFMSDPHAENGTLLQISSRLVSNPEVEAFGINKDKYFTQKELKSLIRKSAHLFPDIAIGQGLIKNLDNFEAKFESHVKKMDDRQGNTEDMVKNAIKFVKGELPTSITLSAPLYLATEPKTLVLEIEIEKQGNVAVFGFYCMELEPLRRKVAEDTILTEVNKLSSKFVCIEQF